MNTQLFVAIIYSFIFLIILLFLPLILKYYFVERLGISTKSYVAINIFFYLPIFLILFYMLIVYFIVFKFEIYSLVEFFGIWFRFIGLFIFDIIVFFYLFRYHREMNLFFKVFFAVGLVLATHWNFQYALLREQGNLFQFFKEPFTGVRLYTGSAPYIKFAYWDYGVWPFYGLWIDSLAVMTGAPFLLMLIILPSFLALPLFFLWTGFSIFYVITPYSFKEKIFERLKSSLKRKRV